MRDLNHQLKQLSRRNRDGSYMTQSNRERLLALIANQLHELGYRGMGTQSLKPKHVEALVARWQGEALSTGTVKNRMSALRWWAKKVNRQNVVARSNESYGIPERRLASNDSKAAALERSSLDQISDPHVRMSLELQRAFGLRREEAIKFIPRDADRGDELVLKASWTKGGKTRAIPVRTYRQREVLGRAHRLAGKGSLIPSARSYRQQLRVYERLTAKAGLSRLHGLRHAYAQQRYEALTGWRSPAAGGPPTRQLTAGQRRIDREARRTISRGLGHERIQIVAIYVGN